MMEPWEMLQVLLWSQSSSMSSQPHIFFKDEGWSCCSGTCTNLVPRNYLCGVLYGSGGGGQLLVSKTCTLSNYSIMPPSNETLVYLLSIIIYYYRCLVDQWLQQFVTQEGSQETVQFVEFFDKSFDSMNVNNSGIKAETHLSLPTALDQTSDWRYVEI